jgi:hypothetical protein
MSPAFTGEELLTIYFLKTFKEVVLKIDHLKNPIPIPIVLYF